MRPDLIPAILFSGPQVPLGELVVDEDSFGSEKTFSSVSDGYDSSMSDGSGSSGSSDSFGSSESSGSSMSDSSGSSAPFDSSDSSGSSESSGSSMSDSSGSSAPSDSSGSSVPTDSSSSDSSPPSGPSTPSSSDSSDSMPSDSLQSDSNSYDSINDGGSLTTDCDYCGCDFDNVVKVVFSGITNPTPNPLTCSGCSGLNRTVYCELDNAASGGTTCVWRSEEFPGPTCGMATYTCTVEVRAVCQVNPDMSPSGVINWTATINFSPTADYIKYQMVTGSCAGGNLPFIINYSHPCSAGASTCVVTP